MSMPRLATDLRGQTGLLMDRTLLKSAEQECDHLHFMKQAPERSWAAGARSREHAHGSESSVRRVRDVV
jgi:hypothetical protein